MLPNIHLNINITHIQISPYENFVNNLVTPELKHIYQNKYINLSQKMSKYAKNENIIICPK
jgi:hypothetical protein